MSLPRIPETAFDNEQMLRRHRETTNNILNFQFDDSRVRTSDEIASSTYPVNPAYEPGNARRNGAVGDNSTDDTAAIQRAVNSSIPVSGFATDSYKLSSGVTLGSVNIVDLEGATVSQSSSTARFTSSTVSATASTTISSGATLGSRSFVVASATGLIVGQWVKISTTGADFPKFWAKITSIASTTIETDRTFPCTYSGTINLDAYNSLNGTLVIRNIVFDGTGATTSAGNDGQSIRLVNYERVLIENIQAINYAPSSSIGFVIQVLDCVDVVVRNCRFTDSTIQDQVNYINVDGARSCVISQNYIHAGGFGINADRCESASFIGNILSGRRAMEDQESITPIRSIRGIKSFACGYVEMIGNHISDFESPVKVERIHRYHVIGNTVRNAGLFTYAGQIALNCGSAAAPEEPFGLIANNLLENCGGIGIGIDNGGSLDENVVVSNNVIKDVGRYAIYCANGKFIACGNKIENWNTSNTGSGDTSAAVYNGGGVIATGNTFENSDATDCCFRTNFVAGQTYSYRDNAIFTSNPYFNGSKVIEMDGATVNFTSAATSVTGNHSLVRTPAQSEIFLEIFTDPTAITNDPGPIAVTAITSTQITIKCRNAPGASTMNVRWEARPKMPFTA